MYLSRLHEGRADPARYQVILGTNDIAHPSASEQVLNISTIIPVGLSVCDCQSWAAIPGGGGQGRGSRGGGGGGQLPPTFCLNGMDMPVPPTFWQSLYRHINIFDIFLIFFLGERAKHTWVKRSTPPHTHTHTHTHARTHTFRYAAASLLIAQTSTQQGETYRRGFSRSSRRVCTSRPPYYDDYITCSSLCFMPYLSCP